MTALNDRLMANVRAQHAQRVRRGVSLALTPQELATFSDHVRAQGLVKGWNLRRAWCEYVDAVHAALGSYPLTAEALDESEDKVRRAVYAARRAREREELAAIGGAS